MKRCSVLDTEIAYHEAGPVDAPVALFFHGNPTSSYIWRNILPEVSAVARCIAPDLVGFGQSGRPRCGYRFADHLRYIEAFLDVLSIENAYLVAQDWGTAIAFALGARRPQLVSGLVFMEFIRPLGSWNEFHQSAQARELFRKFRTPGLGKRLIMDENLFIDHVLPGSILRTLEPHEIAAYQAPFPDRASRYPIWRLPNELPIEGQPHDVWLLLEHAHLALEAAEYPKVLLVGDPGALVSPDDAVRFATRLKNIRVVQLDSGAHYLQEDHPLAIANAVIELIDASRTTV